MTVETPLSKEAFVTMLRNVEDTGASFSHGGVKVIVGQDSFINLLSEGDDNTHKRARTYTEAYNRYLEMLSPVAVG